jgi:hypothetical protein
MTEAEWIDRFAAVMGRLCEEAQPGLVKPLQLAHMARQLYLTHGMLDPEELARSEFNEGPPFHD